MPSTAEGGEVAMPSMAEGIVVAMLVGAEGSGGSMAMSSSTEGPGGEVVAMPDVAEGWSMSMASCTPEGPGEEAALAAALVVVAAAAEAFRWACFCFNDTIVSSRASSDGEEGEGEESRPSL